MKTPILYYFLAMTAATFVPVIAHGQAHVDMTGEAPASAEVNGSGDTTAVSESAVVPSSAPSTEINDDDKEDPDDSKVPRRRKASGFTYAGASFAADSSPAAGTNPGVNVVAGYYTRGRSYGGALRVLKGEGLGISADMTRGGFTFLCDEDSRKRKDMVCQRIDIDAHAAWASGTGNVTAHGVLGWTPTVRFKNTKKLEIGVGAGPGVGGFYTQNLSKDGSDLSGMGVGGQALFYVDAKWINAAVSGSYLAVLDDTSRTRNILTLDAMVSYPLWQNADEGLDLYARGQVLGANVQKTATDDSQVGGMPDGMRFEGAVDGGVIYRFGATYPTPAAKTPAPSPQ